MSTNPSSLASLLFVLVASLGLACATSSGSYYDDDEKEAAPAAAVEPATWNQERVTGIATQLATAVHELRDAVRNDPISNVGSGQASARHRLLDGLRVMTNESKHLAEQLKGGEGREATLPTYERLGVLSRDAEEEARRMFLYEGLMNRLTDAGGLWRQLKPYYVGTEG